MHQKDCVMRTVSHRTSYTVGEGTEKKTEYVWTEVSLPETIEDLQTWKPLHTDGKEVEVCVSYNKATNERIYAKVPFALAMLIDGYKLHINTKVRPKDSIDVSQDDIAAYKAANPAEATVVDLTFAIGQKKHQKSLREKILAWKEQNA